MQGARVLVSGELAGLAAEACKNLCLAGVRALHLQDDSVVRMGDLSCNFLVGEKDLGVPRAAAMVAPLRELNVRVAVDRVALRAARSREPTRHLDRLRGIEGRMTVRQSV